MLNDHTELHVFTRDTITARSFEQTNLTFSIQNVNSLKISIEFNAVPKEFNTGPKMIKNKKKAKAEQRVTMMAAAMVVCTLTAWTPYAVVSLMVTTGYSHLIGPIASVAPAIFAKTSVIYNPIVYFFLNTQVNKSLKKKFQRRSIRERNEDFSVTTNYFYTVDSIKPTVAVATSVPIKSKKSLKTDTSKV
ncbi:medium-wave-sensitive opsin 1-like [Centruroides sculpturatus]|uniref:medium-wave-sensitive opsin 1-like n=1 Tax=Centruroides sculpturatus TaxID=218467 RepID=UPI000C6D533B|nr:medium-wave-sensitive opsin 1-like [Centruroides sculpturatus]